MYLKRKIDTFLEAWKNDVDHNPLIVRPSQFYILQIVIIKI